MECGLIGLQGVGKTTLFSALTAHSIAVQIGSMKPNVGIASIPDPRLNRIPKFIKTNKIIHATLQVVDIPGVPLGGSNLNSVLAHIRNVDALCHVVKCFDGSSPAEDIASMDSELIISDMVVVENAIEKANRTAKHGDKDAQARLDLLKRANELLENEQPIRDGEWDNNDKAILKNYGIMTAKPVLYVSNVSEDDANGESDNAKAVASHARSSGGESIVVCASLESEIAELDPSDQKDMLESMGLAEPAVGPLARALNTLLGLSTFYTAGEKEVRAWSIPQGALAPQAAGTIHSDIERGFIRAECYHVDDLFDLNSEKAIKEAGKLRSEGKGYSMQDGDVVNFLFNV
ncbi:MAG: redox-regulated ATPase YchF [Planctomycetota bacterium]|nr:redox-regulated ATPase YchF [Planctomycetota bacterium]